MAGHNIAVSWSVFKFMCMWSPDERFRMDEEESSQKPVSPLLLDSLSYSHNTDMEFRKVLNWHSWYY